MQWPRRACPSPFYCSGAPIQWLGHEKLMLKHDCVEYILRKLHLSLFSFISLSTKQRSCRLSRGIVDRAPWSPWFSRGLGTQDRPLKGTSRWYLTERGNIEPLTFSPFQLVHPTSVYLTPTDTISNAYTATHCALFQLKRSSTYGAQAPVKLTDGDEEIIAWSIVPPLSRAAAATSPRRASRQT